MILFTSGPVFCVPTFEVTGCIGETASEAQKQPAAAA